jgi:hypothetical protein
MTIRPDWDNPSVWPVRKVRAVSLLLVLSCGHVVVWPGAEHTVVGLTMLHCRDCWEVAHPLDGDLAAALEAER